MSYRGLTAFLSVSLFASCAPTKSNSSIGSEVASANSGGSSLPNLTIEQRGTTQIYFYPTTRNKIDQKNVTGTYDLEIHGVIMQAVYSAKVNYVYNGSSSCKVFAKYLNDSYKYPGKKEVGDFDDFTIVKCSDADRYQTAEPLARGYLNLSNMTEAQQKAFPAGFIDVYAGSDDSEKHFNRYKIVRGVTSKDTQFVFVGQGLAMGSKQWTTMQPGTNSLYLGTNGVTSSCPNDDVNKHGPTYSFSFGNISAGTGSWEMSHTDLRLANCAGAGPEVKIPDFVLAGLLLALPY